MALDGRADDGRRPRADPHALSTSRLLQKEPASSLRRLVGFRNVAGHEYRELDLAKVREVLEYRLDDLLAFGKATLLADPTKCRC